MPTAMPVPQPATPPPATPQASVTPAPQTGVAVMSPRKYAAMVYEAESARLKRERPDSWADWMDWTRSKTPWLRGYDDLWISREITANADGLLPESADRKKATKVASALALRNYRRGLQQGRGDTFVEGAFDFLTGIIPSGIEMIPPGVAAVAAAGSTAPTGPGALAAGGAAFVATAAATSPDSYVTAAELMEPQLEMQAGADGRVESIARVGEGLSTPTAVAAGAATGATTAVVERFAGTVGGKVVGRGLRPLLRPVRDAAGDAVARYLPAATADAAEQALMPHVVRSIRRATAPSFVEGVSKRITSTPRPGAVGSALTSLGVPASVQSAARTTASLAGEASQGAVGETSEEYIQPIAQEVIDSLLSGLSGEDVETQNFSESIVGLWATDPASAAYTTAQMLTAFAVPGAARGAYGAFRPGVHDADAARASLQAAFRERLPQLAQGGKTPWMSAFSGLDRSKWFDAQSPDAATAYAQFVLLSPDVAQSLVRSDADSPSRRRFEAAGFGRTSEPERKAASELISRAIRIRDAEARGTASAASNNPGSGAPPLVPAPDGARVGEAEAATREFWRDIAHADEGVGAADLLLRSYHNASVGRFENAVTDAEVNRSLAEAVGDVSAIDEAGAVIQPDTVVPGDVIDRAARGAIRRLIDPTDEASINWLTRADYATEVFPMLRAMHAMRALRLGTQPGIPPVQVPQESIDGARAWFDRAAPRAQSAFATALDPTLDMSTADNMDRAALFSRAVAAMHRNDDRIPIVMRPATGAQETGREIDRLRATFFNSGLDREGQVRFAVQATPGLTVGEARSLQPQALFERVASHYQGLSEQAGKPSEQPAPALQGGVRPSRDAYIPMLGQSGLEPAGPDGKPAPRRSVLDIADDLYARVILPSRNAKESAARRAALSRWLGQVAGEPLVVGVHRNRVVQEMHEAFGNADILPVLEAYAKRWAAARPGRTTDGYFEMLRVERGGSPGDAGLYQFGDDGTAKAVYELKASGERIIRALADPDASTLPHEVAHDFLAMLPTVDASLAEEAASALGAESHAALTVEHHEQFARAFEAYLRDGKAPSSALRAVFKKFKQFLTDLYRSLTGTPLENQLTPALRAVFNKMLADDVPRRKRAPHGRLWSSKPAQPQQPDLQPVDLAPIVMEALVTEAAASGAASLDSQESQEVALAMMAELAANPPRQDRGSRDSDLKRMYRIGESFRRWARSSSRRPAYGPHPVPPGEPGRGDLSGIPLQALSSLSLAISEGRIKSADDVVDALVGDRLWRLDPGVQAAYVDPFLSPLPVLDSGSDVSIPPAVAMRTPAGDLGDIPLTGVPGDRPLTPEEVAESAQPMIPPSQRWRPASVPRLADGAQRIEPKRQEALARLAPRLVGPYLLDRDLTAAVDAWRALAADSAETNPRNVELRRGDDLDDPNRSQWRVELAKSAQEVVQSELVREMLSKALGGNRKEMRERWSRFFKLVDDGAPEFTDEAKRLIGDAAMGRLMLGGDDGGAARPVGPGGRPLEEWEAELSTPVNAHKSISEEYGLLASVAEAIKALLEADENPNLIARVVAGKDADEALTAQQQSFVEAASDSAAGRIADRLDELMGHPAVRSAIYERLRPRKEGKGGSRKALGAVFLSTSNRREARLTDEAKEVLRGVASGFMPVKYRRRASADMRVEYRASAPRLWPALEASQRAKLFRAPNSANQIPALSVEGERLADSLALADVIKDFTDMPMSVASTLVETHPQVTESLFAARDDLRELEPDTLYALGSALRWLARHDEVGSMKRLAVELRRDLRAVNVGVPGTVAWLQVLLRPDVLTDPHALGRIAQWLRYTTIHEAARGALAGERVSQVQIIRSAAVEAVTEKDVRGTAALSRELQKRAAALRGARNVLHDEDTHVLGPRNDRSIELAISDLSGRAVVDGILSESTAKRLIYPVAALVSRVRNRLAPFYPRYYVQASGSAATKSDLIGHARADAAAFIRQQLDDDGSLFNRSLRTIPGEDDPHGVGELLITPTEIAQAKAYYAGLGQAFVDQIVDEELRDPLAARALGRKIEELQNAAAEAAVDIAERSTRRREAPADMDERAVEEAAGSKYAPGRRPVPTAVESMQAYWDSLAGGVPGEPAQTPTGDPVVAEATKTDPVRAPKAKLRWTVDESGNHFTVAPDDEQYGILQSSTNRFELFAPGPEEEYSGPIGVYSTLRDAKLAAQKHADRTSGRSVLEYNPGTQGAVPDGGKGKVAPLGGAGDVYSGSSIVNYLWNILGIGHFKHVVQATPRAAFSKNAPPAVFLPGEMAGIVSPQAASDLVANLHEIGHGVMLSDLGLVDDLTAMQAQELMSLDYALDKVDIVEGFAEFFRLYITDDKAASQAAPEFYGRFESRLGAKPDFKARVLAARKHVAEYLMADPVARAQASMVDIGRQPADPLLGKIDPLEAVRAPAKDLRNAESMVARVWERTARKLQDFYRAMVNDRQQVSVFQELGDKATGKPAPFGARLDTRIAEAHRKADRLTQKAISKGGGVESIKTGKKLVDYGFHEIVEESGGAETWPLFEAWLWAKTSIDEWHKGRSTALTGPHIKYDSEIKQAQADAVALHDANLIVARARELGMDGRFESARTMLTNFSNATLYLLVESGRLTKPQYDAITSSMVEYMPLLAVKPDDVAKLLGEFLPGGPFSGRRGMPGRRRGHGHDIMRVLDAVALTTHARYEQAIHDDIEDAFVAHFDSMRAANEARYRKIEAVLGKVASDQLAAAQAAGQPAPKAIYETLADKGLLPIGVNAFITEVNPQMQQVNVSVDRARDAIRQAIKNAQLSEETELAGAERVLESAIKQGLPMTMTQALAMYRAASRHPKMQDLYIKLYMPQLSPRPGQTGVWHYQRNDETRVFHVNDPALFEWMRDSRDLMFTSMDNAAVRASLRGIELMAGGFRLGATGLSADFGVSQLATDWMHAVFASERPDLISRAMAPVMYSGFWMYYGIRERLKGMPGTSAALSSLDAFVSKLAGVKWDDMQAALELFAHRGGALGATTGGMYEPGAARRLVRMASGLPYRHTIADRYWDMIENARNLIGSMNVGLQLSEMAYVLHKNQMLSRERLEALPNTPGEMDLHRAVIREALVKGDDMMNHGRAGSFVRRVSPYIPFFNINIQAFDKTIRAVAKNPRRALHDAMWVALGSAAYWFANSDEDWWDENEEYKKIGVLQAGGFDGSEPLFEIPIRGDGVGIVHGAVVSALEAVSRGGDMKTAKHYAYAWLVSRLFSTYNLGGVFQPIIETYVSGTNRFGVPLIPPQLEDVKPADQYTENTLYIMRALGRVLQDAQEAAGLRPTEALSPIKMQHFIDGFSGRQLSTYGAAIERTLTGRPVEARHMPGLRAIVPKAQQMASVSEFYRQLDWIRKEANSAEKAGTLTVEEQTELKRLVIYQQLLADLRALIRDRGDIQDAGPINRHMIGVARRALGKDARATYLDPLDPANEAHLDPRVVPVVHAWRKKLLTRATESPPGRPTQAAVREWRSARASAVEALLYPQE